MYKDQRRAFAASQYPGAELVDAYTVVHAADDYIETLRALLFLV